MPVLPRLATTSTGAGDFAVAADGTLVYVDVPGSLAANARTLVWVDRTGKEEPIAAPPRAYAHPRLSPDGTRVALSSGDQEKDIWIWDLRTGDADAPDARPGPGLVSRVDAGRPADHLQLEPQRRAASSISGGRRPTAPAPPSG